MPDKARRGHGQGNDTNTVTQATHMFGGVLFAVATQDIAGQTLLDVAQPKIKRHGRRSKERAKEEKKGKREKRE